MNVSTAFWLDLISRVCNFVGVILDKKNEYEKIIIVVKLTEKKNPLKIQPQKNIKKEKNTCPKSTHCLCQIAGCYKKWNELCLSREAISSHVWPKAAAGRHGRPQAALARAAWPRRGCSNMLPVIWPFKCFGKNHKTSQFQRKKNAAQNGRIKNL